MTSGERMIWAAAFAYHWCRAETPHGLRAEPWKDWKRGTCMTAVEEAAFAVENLRAQAPTITDEDEDESTLAMLRSMLGEKEAKWAAMREWAHHHADADVVEKMDELDCHGIDQPGGDEQP
jgi:hypothetical protein